MKKLKTVTLLSIVFFAMYSSAQGVTYPVPDYPNTPFLYDKAKNELVEIDATQFVVGARPRGLFGAESSLYIDGVTSHNKIDKNAASFIVKLDGSIDPRLQMDLNRAVVNNHSGKREYVIYKKGYMTAEGNNPTVDISFKKVAENVFLVTAKEPLSSGEYFFSVSANTKSSTHFVYCFTIN